MTTKTGCLHKWDYVHAVYAGSRGGAVIRRWCQQCGTCQVGEITKWRSERFNEFDESPAQAAEAEGDGQ